MCVVTAAVVLLLVNNTETDQKRSLYVVDKSSLRHTLPLLFQQKKRVCTHSVFLHDSTY
jgi:hypothetical protein